MKWKFIIVKPGNSATTIQRAEKTEKKTLLKICIDIFFFFFGMLYAKQAIRASFMHSLAVHTPTNTVC